jgi:hypothetical protein
LQPSVGVCVVCFGGLFVRNYFALGLGLGVGLGLIFVAGSAPANPVGNIANGLLSGGVSAVTNTVGGGAAAAGRAATLVPLPPLAAAGTQAVSLPERLDISSDTALLGLESPTGDAVVVSVLQYGPDGSGYGDVLQLNGETVIGPQLDGQLTEPLLGTSGSDGMVEIAILDGNSTAHAAADGLLSAAVLSGNDQATGGAVGAAVLSGTASGYGETASVGAVNEGDLAHACVGDSCVSAGALGEGPGVIPYTEVAPGIVVGGGKSTPVGSSNPVLNVGALTGDSAGAGGLVGVGVIAGANSGRGDLTGVCVLCGNNAGQGTLGVAVLSGNNSGIGAPGTLPAGVGAAVLSGNSSGNGSTIGGAVLSGDNSGNGAVVGGAILGGDNSGNGGVIGGAIGSGPGSGNGGVIGGGVLVGGGNGSPPSGGGTGDNGGGPVTGIQIPPGVGSKGGGDSGGAGAPTPDEGTIVAEPDDGAIQQEVEGEEDDEATDWRRGACLIVVKNVKDQTTQSMKRGCKKVRRAS